MKNSYVLPICFAAATHGALLFGFSKNPRPPMRLGEQEDFVRIFVNEREEDPPEPVDPDRSDPPPKSAPEVPQPPKSPEPLVLDLGERQTMTPPPFQPVSTGPLSQILVPTVGIPGGDRTNPWKNGVISSTLLDNPPRTRFQATPMYPFQAKREGLHGEVIVEFLVDERGRVLDPRVVSSTHRIFEEETLRAVAKWKFEPGRRDGRIVRFRMAAPVVFNLND